VIEAGSKSMTIINTNVKEKSLINITPISDTENQVLYISNQSNGEFKVNIKEETSNDIEFNWWIMQTE